MRINISSWPSPMRLGIALLDVILGMVGSAAGEEAVTYENIRQALISGADVVAIVRLHKCVMPDGKTPGPAIEGGFQVTDFMSPVY